jgi:uncharacterized 2Fe-2S/4Fe-4S cluster protein (DUF4445 family)
MAQLFVNDRRAPGAEGHTLFDAAEAIAIAVPTSCVKQGKCRECLLEIEEGEEWLSPPTSEESHLPARFRLACRSRLIGEGTVRCHTMRRGAMRVVDDASGLPDLTFNLDPAVSYGYGVALDLGTTTVAMRLYDLQTGALRATQAFENPQRFGGSDVMARIHYDTHHRGRLLQRTFLGYLGRAIEAFPVPADEIREVVVAANTTMRDLFFGLPVESIGQKPYRSVTEHEYLKGQRSSTAIEAEARKLRLPLHPEARVYGLPLIGSHVGADAAASLLATRMFDAAGVHVLMDIGTNSEIVAAYRGRMVAASCPAGPAFEGGGVRAGMPALEGAIESVVMKDDGSFRTNTIGGGPAQGICGSGLVHLLGELLRTGRMNAQGRFSDEVGTIVLKEGRITFSESDVNELAQAKGANVAGLQIVRDVLGFDFPEVERFYLAGGFAKHLNLDAARRIGLVPPLRDDRLVLVGNAALEGASLALLSRSLRGTLEDLVSHVEHIELETHERFFDFFVEGCQFVPIGAEVFP